MQRNTTTIDGNSSGVLGLGNDGQHARLEAKLKRELGEKVLELLFEATTEDIV